MTRLLLVRHGESLWNAERRLQGQADVSLSTRGQQQARQLADSVRFYQPDHVVCSDLRRTCETTALLGYSEPASDARWREADLGEWTGRSIDELRAERAEEYVGWREGRWTPPKAETFEQLCRRISDAVEGLRHLNGTVLVVTHGGPIRAVLANLLDIQPSEIVPANPASLSAIDLNGRPRLRAYNVTPSGGLLDPPD